MYSLQNNSNTHSSNNPWIARNSDETADPLIILERGKIRDCRQEKEEVGAGAISERKVVVASEKFVSRSWR